MRERPRQRDARAARSTNTSKNTGTSRREHMLRTTAKNRMTAQSNQPSTRRIVHVAVVAAALAGACADAQPTAQLSSRPPGVCPLSAPPSPGASSTAVSTEWHTWTTHGCAVNCAGATAANDVVCAYWNTTSVPATQRAHTCWRSAAPVSGATTTAAADGHAPFCVVTGACLVACQPVSHSSRAESAWTFQLRDTVRVGATDSAVRVGALAVPAHVTSLTFDGRASDSARTAVDFAARELLASAALESLVFIGLDVSTSGLPHLPASLRDLHIQDCSLHDLPLAQIAALPQLATFALERNVMQRRSTPSDDDDGASSLLPAPLLTDEQLAFLRARTAPGSTDTANRDAVARAACPPSYRDEALSGIRVCVSPRTTAVERQLTTKLRTANATAAPSATSATNGTSSSSGNDSVTTKSIYILASLAGPALYFLYKLGLYLYFYSTYSKHVKSLQNTSSGNGKDSSGTQDDDDDLDTQRMTEHASSSAPDSLVLPPRASLAVPPTADQRRYNNMSFWIDEELQDWRMDFSQIKQLKCLTPTLNQQRRHGANAPSLRACEVWLGTFYPQGAPDAEQPVVLKWLAPAQANDAAPSDGRSAVFDTFKGTIKRQAQLSHPNVVKFFGIVWSRETHLVAVTEYMARGDVRQWLHRSAVTESGRWSVQKVQILLDVAKALLYLHSMRPTPLLHGNCNSRNVLLNDRMRAKLSDFGATKDSLSERELQAYSAVGSGRWISPEALVGRDSRVASLTSGAADVYSLGILMSEMDTHELPFSDLMQANRVALPETDVLQLIAKGALSPTLSLTCPSRIGRLIERCTAFSPKHRPSSRDVVQELQEIAHAMKAEASDAHTRHRGPNDSDSDDNDDLRDLTLTKGVVV